MKKRLLCAASTILFVCLGLALQERRAESAPVAVEYYYKNPCASCNVEGEFVVWFWEQVHAAELDTTYTIEAHNTFATASGSGTDHLNKALERLGLTEMPPLPLLVIGNQYLAGDEAITNGIAALLATGKAPREESPEAEEAPFKHAPNLSSCSGKPYLLYYYADFCGDCQKAADFLEELPGLDGAVLEKRNSTAAGELQALFDFFDAPDDRRIVPVIFYEGGYLAGYEAISSGLEQLLTDGAADYAGFIERALG